MDGISSLLLSHQLQPYFSLGKAKLDYTCMKQRFQVKLSGKQLKTIQVHRAQFIFKLDNGRKKKKHSKFNAD
jgi:hypothetical protein